MSERKTWMSNAEAQVYLGVSSTWLKRIRASASVHFYKVGGKIFYKTKDLDELIIKNKVV